MAWKSIMCCQRSAVWMHGRSFFAVLFTRESHLCGVGAAALAADTPKAPEATRPSRMSHDFERRGIGRCGKEPSPRSGSQEVEPLSVDHQPGARTAGGPLPCRSDIETIVIRTRGAAPAGLGATAFGVVRSRT